MKLALVLVAALSAPTQESEPDMYVLTPGQKVQCVDPSGCVITSAEKMLELIEKIQSQKTCGTSI